MDCRGCLHLFLQFANPADVVDMRVRADDLLCRQAVLCKSRQNFLGIVAGVNDDGFARLLVAQYRAVTLKPSDRKCFDDHNLNRFYDPYSEGLFPSLEGAIAQLQDRTHTLNGLSPPSRRGRRADQANATLP